MSAPDGADRVVAVSRAVARASQRLGVTPGLLAAILGIPEPAVRRLSVAGGAIPGESNAYLRAQLFLQLFHNLKSAMSGDDEAAKTWLHSPCLGLNARPINLIQTVPGLIKAVEFLKPKSPRPAIHADGP